MHLVTARAALLRPHRFQHHEVRRQLTAYRLLFRGIALRQQLTELAADVRTVGCGVFFCELALLTGILCITKVYRKIRNDHTFSYGNKLCFIESPLKHSIANQKIEIRAGKDKQFSAYFAGRQLQVSEVTEPVKASMKETDVQKKLDVLGLADKLSNVAEASRLSGVSRDSIYRHRRLLKKVEAAHLNGRKRLI